ncbi:hypothetical protein [Cupriavidus lacunae]|uniref:hypothetical protein n=1 Tax=Cupriavidus lacunae TaxID=2666307 RepID=UPI001FC8F15C|nr:hypothetical protein [Cupriavidus lacunae]
MEWRRARYHRQPLSLLMLDVGHFKQFDVRPGRQIRGLRRAGQLFLMVNSVSMGASYA